MNKKHREKDIIITHGISIDVRIADEIEKLNNEHGIFTLSSCCGHSEAGYIIVIGNDIQEMIRLKYEMTVSKYLDHDFVFGDKIVICNFRPQSKCDCPKSENI